MSVLQALARARVPLTTQAIATACDIPKSSAHHLLNVMRARGFLDYRDAERSWVLGPTVLEVAAAYQHSDPLQVEGGRILVELSEQAGLTAHLAVLQGTNVLYLDKRDPSRDAVKLVTEVGSRLPAPATAVGQALLAFLPPEQLEGIFDGYDFPAVGTSEPRDFEDLARHLDRVRRRGVAHDVGFITAGISCLAAPVFDKHQLPVASIGVTFITAQVAAERLDQLMALVRVASANLSLALGSRVASPQGAVW
jgi:DNA-binding IclR family transcriptional regulator